MDTAIARILASESRAKRLNLFESYLTVWVGLCMVAGIVLGELASAAVQLLRSMEFGEGSHVNFLYRRAHMADDYPDDNES